MPATRSKPSSTQKPFATSKRVKCSAYWCSKTFNRAADMRKHADHKHLGFFYQCIHCGHKGSQKDAIETHVNSVHTGQQNSVCSCGEGFTDPSSLSKHRKTTGHAGVRSIRGTSGAVVRGREPGTEHLTYELLACSLYIPAAYTEDTFSFYPSSSEAKSSPSGTKKEEVSPSLPPTSMHSSFDFGVIEPCSPLPRSYEPTIQAPEIGLGYSQFLPESLSAPLDSFPSVSLDYPSFSLDSEDFSSLTFPSTSQSSGFGSGCSSSNSFRPTSFNFLPEPVNANFVAQVQDSFLERMEQWSQSSQSYLANLPALPPVPEQQFSFLHDLNMLSY